MKKGVETLSGARASGRGERREEQNLNVSRPTVPGRSAAAGPCGCRTYRGHLPAPKVDSFNHNGRRRGRMRETKRSGRSIIRKEDNKEEKPDNGREKRKWRRKTSEEEGQVAKDAHNLGV
jgi:hypothetical protein